MTLATPPPPQPMRIFMIGATGTIGAATLRCLLARGHHVCAVIRPSSRAQLQAADDLGGRLTLVSAELADAPALLAAGMEGRAFDAVLSCLASRTGQPDDAEAVDNQAHQALLAAAQRAGTMHFVYLSAICVQKPLLPFQRAKRRFEDALIQSGLRYSIVRPTAFFKSLSGQVIRVQQGKPYLLFGNGEGTACKPISDRDLAHYLADCLHDPARHNRVLPIGGPGPALTPRAQGEMLFALIGRRPRFRRVPVLLLDVVAGVLGALGMLSARARSAAHFARIGRYYATESMLLWDAEHGRYDAAATPETGQDQLRDHFAALLRGDAQHLRSDHSVF